jgi:uncharacterized membrane-anchored protein YhcB (DUF1043 family)
VIADILESMIWLFAVVAICATPIVWLFLRHQQKMAAFYQSGRTQDPITSLANQVQDLKETADQQAIILDNLASQQRELLVHLAERSRSKQEPG